MKKIIAAVLAIILLVPCAAEAANKQLENARKKELKQRLKDFKKAKWEVLGSHTMEVALASHYDKLNTLDEDAHEVVGVSTRSQSKNVGKQMAMNNAALEYAQNAGSTLKGRVVTDMSGSGIETTAEFDNFYAAYERLVEKEIRGEMQPSFTIIRTNPDGTYEIQSYFIVSENAASKARLRALENAFKESEAARQYADKISAFVREGFQD